MGERHAATSTSNARYLTGGMDYWCRNSPTNQNWGGAVLNKSDMIDFLAYYQAQNLITEADIFARPEICVELNKLFLGELMFEKSLPNKISMNVQKLILGNTTYRFHAVQTLKELNNDNMYVVDMSGTRKEKPIRVGYISVGGGTETTNGRPTVIDKQQNPSYSGDKSQIVAGMGFVIKGSNWGRHAILSNAAHV